MVRFPLMDAGLLSDVIKDHEATKVKEPKAHVGPKYEIYSEYRVCTV